VAEAEHHNTIARDTRTVALVTLLSRVFGLARDLVTVRIFGDTLVGSAFAAAFAIPNLFRRLFGEGALSAAFIPKYTKLAQHDPALADRYASLILASLVGVTTTLLVLIEAVVLALMALTDDPSRAFSLELVAIVLPFMPMICTTAILGGLLQIHGRFFPSAAAPIILNCCIIAAALLAIILNLSPERAAVWIGASTLIAGGLQLAWVAAELRGKVRWGRAFHGVASHARETMVTFLPVLIGLGTLQLNALADTIIAMWPTWVGPTFFGHPVPMDEASNAVLGYTQRLYQFPLGVFGIAVATAAFPALARTASTPKAFTSTIARGLRLSLFIGLPASVGLLLVRQDLVAVMFSGGGGFSERGLHRASAVLAGYAIGVFAYSLNHLLSRAFYALGDTRTPMRLSLAMVFLNITGNLILIWPLREAGLAWSTAATAIVQTSLLAWMLRRKIGSLGAAIIPAMARTAVLALLMGLVTWLVLALIPEAEQWKGHALRLVASVGAGMLTYAGLALVLRVPEGHWLVRGS